MSLFQSIGDAGLAHHVSPEEVREVFVLRAVYTVRVGDREVVCEEELNADFATEEGARAAARVLRDPRERSLMGRLWDRVRGNSRLPTDSGEIRLYRRSGGANSRHGYELVGAVPAAA